MSKLEPGIFQHSRSIRNCLKVAFINMIEVDKEHLNKCLEENMEPSKQQKQMSKVGKDLRGKIESINTI